MSRISAGRAWRRLCGCSIVPMRDFEGVVVVVVLLLPVSDAMVAGVDTLLGMVVLLLNCGSAGSSIEAVSRIKRERAFLCGCEGEREKKEGRDNGKA
jgi:hypothetical protein